jgi:hypothetical protein
MTPQGIFHARPTTHTDPWVADGPPPATRPSCNPDVVPCPCHPQTADRAIENATARVDTIRLVKKSPKKGPKPKPKLRLRPRPRPQIPIAISS